MKKVYLIGSLRNPVVQQVGNALRKAGVNVFDDWLAAGPIADDSWKEYEQSRGRSYEQALYGYAATHVFAFDRLHLDDADAGVLVLPAGKSGHMELGYLIGQGKPSYVLFDEDPTWRWDVMYRLATRVFFNAAELVHELRARAGPL